MVPAAAGVAILRRIREPDGVEPHGKYPCNVAVDLALDIRHLVHPHCDRGLLLAEDRDDLFRCA